MPLKDKEEKKAYAKKYYNEHKEEAKQQAKKWGNNNKGKRQKSNTNYRQKLKKENPLRYKATTLRGTINSRHDIKITSDDVEKKLKETLGKNCIYCNSELTLKVISCDHKISILHGGTNNLGNLEFQICKRCNRSKGQFDVDFFTELMILSEKYKEKKILLARLSYAGRMFSH